MRWEYWHTLLTTETPPAERITILDRIGGDGWELVSTISEAGGVRCYFKRPIGRPVETKPAPNVMDLNERMRYW